MKLVRLWVITLGLSGVGLFSIPTTAHEGAGSIVVVEQQSLAAIDVVHLVAIAGGIQGPGFLGRVVSIGFTTILSAALTGAGIVLTARGRDDGLFLIVFGAVVATLAGRIADIDVLSRSATPSLLPIGGVRLLVATTIGLGLSIVLCGVTLLSKKTIASASCCRSDSL